jgi:hypothetical protein
MTRGRKRIERASRRTPLANVIMRFMANKDHLMEREYGMRMRHCIRGGCDGGGDTGTLRCGAHGLKLRSLTV